MSDNNYGTEQFRDYLASFGEYKLLSEDEEVECYNNKDFDKLILHNARLVFSIGFRRCYKDQIPIEDVISAGFECLVKAAHAFDPKKGRFSTLAVVSIHRAIRGELETNVLVHIPQNKIKDLYKKKSS